MTADYLLSDCWLTTILTDCWLTLSKIKERLRQETTLCFAKQTDRHCNSLGSLSEPKMASITGNLSRFCCENHAVSSVTTLCLLWPPSLFSPLSTSLCSLLSVLTPRLQGPGGTEPAKPERERGCGFKMNECFLFFFFILLLMDRRGDGN